GRPPELHGVERIVGLFINTLPVRMRIDPQQRTLAWLRDIQAQQAESRQYEYAALSDIQKWSETPRDVPLFQTTFVYENFSDKAFEDSYGDKLTPKTAQLKIVRAWTVETRSYPLAVMIGSNRSNLQLKIGYDVFMYSADVIDCMLQHYATALE